jgi:flagellar export protein FliJ
MKTSNTIRSRVVDATSKRKVLESLKDKKVEEYHQLLSQAEQKLLDEVGITAYYRKQINSKNTHTAHCI